MLVIQSPAFSAAGVPGTRGPKASCSFVYDIAALASKSVLGPERRSQPDSARRRKRRGRTGGKLGIGKANDNHEYQVACTMYIDPGGCHSNVPLGATVAHGWVAQSKRAGVQRRPCIGGGSLSVRVRGTR